MNIYGRIARGTFAGVLSLLALSAQTSPGIQPAVAAGDAQSWFRVSSGSLPSRQVLPERQVPVTFYSVGLQPSGRMLLSGADFMLRLNANGDVDPTFGAGDPTSAASQPRGLATGEFLRFVSFEVNARVILPSVVRYTSKPE
jgi:hypothetical protein